jgi:hypothetical protein
MLPICSADSIAMLTHNSVLIHAGRLKFHERRKTPDHKIFIPGIQRLIRCKGMDQVTKFFIDFGYVGYGRCDMDLDNLPKSLSPTMDGCLSDLRGNAKF